MKISSGKQHTFVAVDRVTKFTHVAFFDRATKANAAQFLRRVIEAFPYQIHTVLTDNGVAFPSRKTTVVAWLTPESGASLSAFAWPTASGKNAPGHITPGSMAWSSARIERSRTRPSRRTSTAAWSSCALMCWPSCRATTSANTGKRCAGKHHSEPYARHGSKDPGQFGIRPHHLTAGLNIYVAGLRAQANCRLIQSREAGFRLRTPWRLP
nr:hypothetical protein [Paraburkholderia lycopersici]